MIATIVPIKNEEKNLDKVMTTLSQSKTDVIIPVFNGCSDNSLNTLIASKIKYKKKIIPKVFKYSLGIDVPRAVGAKLALDINAKVVLFFDGDMGGSITVQINQLIDAVQLGLDMALTDCYENYFNYNSLAQIVLYFRRKLNLEMGIFEKIGVASPSHGPHAVSRRFLEKIPLNELAIPPISLTLAVKKNLIVDVAASIPHHLLGSHMRNDEHVIKVAETIIGDSIEAMEVFHNKKRTRTYLGKTFNGYHQERDFETLAKIIKKRKPFIFI